jgi:tetratricopeptide (TPR) repeat protein
MHDMSDCPDESELAALLEGLADPTLRRRIDAHIAGCSRCAAVLAAYVREGGGTRSEWGETSAARPSSQAPDDGLADGATLGRFVVLGRLGAGAMGIVYLAHDRQLDRRVAIKLVRAALLVHPDSRARLLREAQAMARISHPNVIAVYEAGEHADQIYVVMELIKGVTLRTWLGQARGWREVLACFLQAGRGLAAAHTAGLVHRDFKPDNVLVSARGEVKVTDFGLARALEAGDGWADTVTGGTIPTHDRSLAFDRSLTAAGVAIGTPAYMSPEQIEGRADARSDQFSFCVALWEALYGQRPFTGATIAEVWHKVGAGAFTPVPRDIKVPMHVQAALRRGLAVRAEARFADLDALLATLADDPAARRRRIAASVGLAGGLIVAGLALARGEAATAPTCAGAPERLHGAWDASRRSVVRDALLATGQGRAADTWARVAATLDDYAARWAEAHLETCLAHQRGEQSGAALDLRMSCLEHRRGELAALTDALTTIDAAALDEAARGAASLRPLAACADLTALQRRAEQVTPPSSERAPMVAAVRAEIDAAEARERTGQYAAGLVRVDRALKRAGTLVYEPLAAEARLARGRLLERLGRYEEADADLGAALAAADRAGHDEVRAEAAVWRLAVSGQRLARHDEAARWAELAGAIVDRVAAPPDLRSRFYRTRGALELERGEYAAALTTYERALAQGGVSPGERAAVLGGVSSVHVALGDNPAAEQRLLQALPLLERTLGPHHPELGLVLNNLGNVQSYQGRRAEALATFERGLSLREQALGPAHPLTAALRLNHGGQLAQVGRFDEALAQLRRARADLVAAHGPRHPHIAYADANLGEVLVARGERDAARLAFQSALALREQLLGPDHPDLGTLLVSLGELALESGGLVEAEAAFSRAIALYTADPSHPHFDLPSARAGLGRVALARGRLTEAITSLAEAEAAAVASDLDPLRIASIRFALAQALGATQADLARARTLAGLAEAALVDGGPPRAAELAQVRAWLTGHPS